LDGPFKGQEVVVHYTEDAAYSNFWNKGVIRVGADADFVQLSQNPLKASPHAIREITVRNTFNFTA
jgi:predicted amidohydrolase YtcJ